MKESKKDVLPDGPVYLTEDSPDAKSHLCRAGMRIAPNVDGWPAHRVLNTLRKGMATTKKPGDEEPKSKPEEKAKKAK